MITVSLIATSVVALPLPCGAQLATLDAPLLQSVGGELEVRDNAELSALLLRE